MACPICKQDQVINTEELSTCLDCHHIWQTDLKVRAVYDASYVHSRYDVYPTTESMSYLRLGFVMAFASRGRLLDVGYGNGRFLKSAATAGFDVWGSDVHGADYGIRDVTLKEAADRVWDVVTFFDSLEHIPDLHFARLTALQARVVVVSVPCRPREFPVGRDWKHFRPGEHLHYFSTESLQRFFFGKCPVWQTDVEDAIRGKLPDGQQNILTTAFVG